MYGDLSKLNEEQKLQHYRQFCESVGLNPLTNPVQYINLNGKLTLYAGKNCTEQLRERHKVSIEITNKEKFDDIYIVNAKATLPDGRTDEATGAVNIKGLVGDALANAFMKAETKAKRRATLSITGLGILDETEVESIPNAQTLPPPQQAPPIKEAKQRGRPPKEVAPKAIVSTNPGDFLITFTKGFKGKKISELSEENLQKLCVWCIENSQFPDFQEAAEAYINAKKEHIEVDSVPVEDFPAFDEDEKINF